jgi:hypothetical protein
MTGLVVQTPSFDELTIVKLAREIAMDLRPIEDIVESLGISSPEWDAIQALPLFQDRVRTATEEWQSGMNTSERVRMKSLAFVEEALPEFFARAHDPKEGLAAKTEVLKTISKFAGIGRSVDGVGSGERMVVTINLGADHQLKVEKNVTPQVIEGQAL